MLPPYLKAGDTIAITATARKVSSAEIAPAIRLLEGWGLKVRLADRLFSEAHQFAGDDTLRANALQQLLDDDNVKAIICARGGYGTVRIIDQLDFSRFNIHPKWIIGYSDITVLHSHLFRHSQVATLHATMAFSVQPDLADADSIESLKQILFGAHTPCAFDPHPLNRAGNTSAKLVGGNLSVLYSLLGSPSDIDPSGCILFLEDLDEYLYHIDRMMVNMKRAGKLSDLVGLIIGGMNDMKDNAVPFGKTAYEIIAEHVAAYDYPVAFGFPAGHEKKNLAMALGGTYNLQVQQASCILECKE